MLRIFYSVIFFVKRCVLTELIEEYNRMGKQIKIPGFQQKLN
jgi:hypothetical protein